MAADTRASSLARALLLRPRLRLDWLRPPNEYSLASWQALGLGEGVRVYAQVKAVALAPGRGDLGRHIRRPSTCRERIRLSQPLEWHRLSARLRLGNTRQEYADDEPAGNAEVRAARRLAVVR
jgi:hypothetical protein